MFRAHRAHHQERQILSIQPLVTVILCSWPRCEQVGHLPRIINDARSTKCKIAVAIQSLGRFVGLKFHTQRPEFEPSSLCAETWDRAQPHVAFILQILLEGTYLDFFCFIVEEWRPAYRILFGKAEGKRPVGRPRYRRYDDIERGHIYDGMTWTGLGYGHVLGCYEHGDELNIHVTVRRNRFLFK